MALVVSSPRTSFRKPSSAGGGGGMLIDYLRDDMSSCSSNGFRSFPRRQCCIAVRNRIEAEVRGRTSTSTAAATRTTTSKMITKKRPRGGRRPPPKYSSSCVPKLIPSRLHRASTALINKAVKLLPHSFTSPSLSSSSSSASTKIPLLLPRSLSKKLVKIKTSFWTNMKSRRQTAQDCQVKEGGPCEIERWIYSGVASLTPTSDYHPRSNYDIPISNKPTHHTSSNTTTSTSTDDDDSAAGGSKADSWSESEFTIICSSSITEESFLPGSDEAKETSAMFSPSNHQVSRNGGATPAATIIATDHSVLPGNTTNNIIVTQEETQHCDDHEKQSDPEFSPVSVLDFPGKDAKGNPTPSPFSNKLAHMEGTKTNLMQRLQGFECLSRVDPVNLLHNGIFEVDSSDSSPNMLSISSASLNFDNFIFSEEESEVGEEQEEEEEEEEEDGDEDEVEKEDSIDHTKQKTDSLIQLVKSKVVSPTTGHNTSATEHLLRDFFTDYNKVRGGYCESDYSLVKKAEDWLNGCYDELLLGWEVKDKREAYIRDMEEGGVWKSTDAYKDQVALRLEAQVLDCLLDELLLQLILPPP